MDRGGQDIKERKMQCKLRKVEEEEERRKGKMVKMSYGRIWIDGI